MQKLLDKRYIKLYNTHVTKVTPCGPLAQLAEHLTFNQGVPRSSRGWITKKQLPFERTGVFLFQSSYSTGCDSLLISIRKSSPDKKFSINGSTTEITRFRFFSLRLSSEKGYYVCLKYDPAA